MPWSMSTRHITPHEWPCHKWWRNWSYSLWLFDPKRSCQNYQIGLPNLLHLVKCMQWHVCLAAWLCHTGYFFSTKLIKPVGILYIWRHVCHTVRAIHYMRKHSSNHGTNDEVITFGIAINNVLIKVSNRFVKPTKFGRMQPKAWMPFSLIHRLSLLF